MSNADPYYQRELQRYANPVASREHILATIKKARKPLTALKLAKKLGIDDDQQSQALAKRLRAMELEGQLVCNRRSAYGLVSHMDLRVGYVRGAKDASGLFMPENGDDHIRLSSLQMQRVFEGDRIVVSPRARIPEGDMECVITDILQRNTRRLIGFYSTSGDIGYVEPRNKRIRNRIITHGSIPGLKNGALVEVEITRQPDRHQQPEGKLISLFGGDSAELDEIQIALRTQNLPADWPDDALHQAEALPDLHQGTHYSDRVDLRSLPLVTIDGADSRDFDDAVYCQRQGRGWKLIVAVADVSHYVEKDSPLDLCAMQRGNSVYFPRQVIPMLPERLSNDLCSLNAQVDRLVMVCEMQLGKSGTCNDYQVYQAVMHSHARLTYDAVNDFLQRGIKPEAKVGVLDNLTQLGECYQALDRQRHKRGALTIDLPEHVFQFDASGKVSGMVQVLRGPAHKLIEEAMVLANSCVAKLLGDAKLATLYRVHPSPDAAKVETFRRFVKATMGLNLGGRSKPKPKDFDTLISKLGDHALGEHVIPMVLKTMQQASYSPHNLGHFGLALEHYCHFTSPIRRYPDLLVHRGLKALLSSGKRSGHLRRASKQPHQKLADIYPYSSERLGSLGLSCSMSEHRATEAAYDVLNFLSCTYLSKFIGKSFDGTVKSITSFGLFVGIGTTNLDGLIHISNLHSDYYHFDADQLALVGERTGRKYSLGDSLRVTLTQVDRDKGRIDLMPEDAKPKRRNSTRRKNRYGGKPASERTGKGNGNKHGNGASPAARPTGGKRSESGNKRNGPGNKRNGPGRSRRAKPQAVFLPKEPG